MTQYNPSDFIEKQLPEHMLAQTKSSGYTSVELQHTISTADILCGITKGKIKSLNVLANEGRNGQLCIQGLARSGFITAGEGLPDRVRRKQESEDNQK